MSAADHSSVLPQGEATAGPWETLGPSSPGHSAVRVLDTSQMPLLDHGGFPLPPGWGTKVLFARPDGAALELLHIPPGAEGAPVHYHEFHEWVYLVDGDFTNNESTTPDNYSILQRFRQGTFMSRPAYSLHGGERGRMKWMASQTGAVVLNMGEADVQAQTFSVDPSQRGANPVKGRLRYNPDYASITHWTTPRIIDTIDQMPWQPVPGESGLNVKYLIDDPLHGFRATMYFLEAGAPTPEWLGAQFYRQALELNFVIAGDLAIEAYAAPGRTAQRMQLGRHCYVERPATGIFGLAANQATRHGAVWLQVTYARGHRWTEVLTPIEDPNFLRA
jgi:hypothetical protein